MRLAVLVLLTGCQGLFEVPSMADANGPPGSVDAGTLAEVTTALLREWSGCMSLTNFQSSSMTSWADLMSTNFQTCSDCHMTGQDGFIATPDAAAFFATISTDKSYLLQYFSVDLTAGVATAKVVVNHASFDAVGNAVPPHTTHPTFDSMTNQGMAALLQFYDLTLQRKLMKACDPPRLKN